MNAATRKIKRLSNERNISRKSKWSTGSQGTEKQLALAMGVTHDLRKNNFSGVWEAKARLPRIEA